MGRPIEIGLGKSRRRQAERETRSRGMERAIDDVGEGRYGIGIAPVDRVGRGYCIRVRDETQGCLVGGPLHVRWCIRLRRDCSRHGAPILYPSILLERAWKSKYVVDLLQRNDLDQSLI